MKSLSRMSKQIELVAALLTEDNFKIFLSGYIKASETIVKEVKEGKKLFEIHNSVDYSNCLLDILDFTKSLENK